jgi:hypothetical protein
LEKNFLRYSKCHYLIERIDSINGDQDAPIRTFPFMSAFGIFTSATLVGETHQVVPDRYYVTFSAAHEPIAHLRAGDTVVTKCLDSRGRDETGKLILDDDNVLTGPFMSKALSGVTLSWSGSTACA